MKIIELKLASLIFSLAMDLLLFRLFSWCKFGKEEGKLYPFKSIGRKIKIWTAISSRGKTLLYLYEHMDAQNYLKVLEDYWKIRELKRVSRSDLFLQINNDRFYWSIEALKFYQK